MWPVLYHPKAAEERGNLPPAERAALDNAVEKLQALGPRLGYPHTSAVQGKPGGLRELRPRRGNSPNRGIYRRVKQDFVMASVCPEAEHDRAAFDRGSADALKRLEELEETAEEGWPS